MTICRYGGSDKASKRQDELMSLSKTTLRLLAVGAVALAASRSAYAIPTLTLSDGVDPAVVVSDASGVVTYSGALGNFNVNITTGITNPVVGTLEAPVLDISS